MSIIIINKNYTLNIEAENIRKSVEGFFFPQAVCADNNTYDLYKYSLLLIIKS